MPRRHDPERRQRIIAAAIRVVERGGIAALSHRTVAAEADVPLGSTTYHFATLDDLLVAALEQVGSDFRGAMRTWEGALAAVDAPPLAEALTRLLERYVTGAATGEAAAARTGREAEQTGEHGETPSGTGRTSRATEPGTPGPGHRHGRGRVRLEYELYLAALRRPQLQPLAAAWLDDIVEVFGRHTADLGAARALAALMDGLLLQLLLTDRPFDRAEVRAALARITGEA